MLSKSTNTFSSSRLPAQGRPGKLPAVSRSSRAGLLLNEGTARESIQNRDNPLFIRRVKEELKDFDGKPLFLPRHVSTVSFRLDEEDDEEKELYNDLSRYVTSIQQSSVERQEEKYRFALVILQRRFASSTYALLRSLERRKDRLEEMLKTAELRQSTPQIDYDDIEDMSEEDR